MKPSHLAAICCICLCKDTNFKANHNYASDMWCRGQVVYAYAKILILKQITTSLSKGNAIFRCICLCKDTNFKANHNNIDVVKKYLMLYMPMQRY